MYFYSPKELTCNGRISFPQGEITEYYPMPDLPGIPVRAIERKGVELLPGRAVNLPMEKGSNHYYRARATESVPLRVWKGNVVAQHEKFLFYRGVGTFAMPLSVQVSADKVAMRQAVTPGIGEVTLFESRNGRASFLRSGLQSSSGVVDRLLPDGSVESLKRDLEMLARRPRPLSEGKGFRVFYVLPRQQTDAILPLAITPKPTKLVRVLVGRMETMTPEAAQEIVRLLTRLKRVPGTQNAEVSEIRERYGRVLAPMIRRVLERHPALWHPALESSLESLGLPAREGNLAQVN